MSDLLTSCLERLEAAIDPEWEDHKIETWKRCLDFEPFAGGFSASESRREPKTDDWPEIGTNEAIRDPEKMLLQQIGAAYDVAARQCYRIMSIRCNFGTGLLPSLFGAETFWMDDELNTLPTARPMGEEAVNDLLETGVPDLDVGFGGDVFEFADFFRRNIEPYPKIREYLWFYHPDLQGPVDVLELLWGSDMFYAFVDQPEKVKRATELVTETYTRFLKRWLAENPPKSNGEYMAHWGYLVKGQVFLRDDSVMNLSRATYTEFVKPFDDRLLETFGGGGIHFCGTLDHAIDDMTDGPHLTMIQMSQPHLNDMPRIVEATIGKGKTLVSRYEDTMADCSLDRGYVRP